MIFGESEFAHDDTTPDEYGRVECVHCGSMQYEGSPYCLCCGRDDPIPTLAPKEGISQGHMMDVKGEMGGYQG